MILIKFFIRLFWGGCLKLAKDHYPNDIKIHRLFKIKINKSANTSNSIFSNKDMKLELGLYKILEPKNINEIDWFPIEKFKENEK